MTLVSDDPSWWPSINASRISSYFIVASSVGMIYDWALTFGQEVELIWRQRRSLMTVLYLSLRYSGILYVVICILPNVSTISIADAFLEQFGGQYTDCHSCRITFDALDSMNEVVDVILGVIIIIRLHAMYQRSRKVLIFLVVIFLTIRIANTVMTVIFMMRVSREELVLSGTYQCTVDYREDANTLASITWVLGTVWDVLALSFAVWIAVKNFLELRRHSARGIIGDCFTVLITSHVSYFASYVVVAFLLLRYYSPTISANPYSLEPRIYKGFTQVFQVAQMFVLGPRLILSIREYHAKVVAGSDTAIAMSSIALQERVHVPTSSSV